MVEYCLAKAEVEGSSPFSRFLQYQVLYVKVRLLVLGTSIFRLTLTPLTSYGGSRGVPVDHITCRCTLVHHSMYFVQAFFDQL